MNDDLELKDLEQFTGTTKYIKVRGMNVTDGVAYIMENGYSWFVTDCIAVIKCGEIIKNEPFLSVKLMVKEREADLVITDGNDKVLYRQHYGYTDAKRDLNLYCCDDVLMLSKEY